MQAFLVRFLVVASLFLLGSFLEALTGLSYIAIALWFVALVSWTLLLGFRRALFIIIPFLLFADVLWDAKIGMLFLAGFLTTTGTAYVAVRIEDRSQLLQTAVYSLMIAFFATLVTWIPMGWPRALFTPDNLVIISKVFAVQLTSAALLFIPFFTLFRRIEAGLDTSYREQSKKIR